MSGSCEAMRKILRSSYSNSQRKLISIPLQFDHLPVDILAKQFTKLNSIHPYRIHYLGPRFPNTQILHKKYSCSDQTLAKQAVPDRNIEKYIVNIKKIVTSFTVNERLRNNNFYKGSLYYRAFEGMNPTLNLGEQCIFDSAFQSGNLDCVIQYKPLKYDCFLRIDSNTKGHTQWYYFCVKNGPIVSKITINLCNISKFCNLYEQGLEPFCFSKKQFEQNQVGWKQGSPYMSQIQFTRKNYRYSILQGKVSQKMPFCLSFDYEFQYANDQVYFAYCVPYTYSEMLHDINNLPKQCCQVHNFAKSLSGLDMPMLVISDHKQDQADENNDTNKKNILITGRVHPGETNSSHMLQGFLSFLCGKSSEARDIRQRTNIFVIPMLNPDGVVLGNTRTSVAGKDLNRIFTSPDPQIYPEIFQLKQAIKQFSKIKKTFLYLDFHGHSGRKNTFFYGPSYALSHPNYYKARIFPKIIESINNSFRFYSCSFLISEQKKGTGRAFMFQNMYVPFTFTLESSIGLFHDPEKLKTVKFEKEKWNKIGEDVCRGMGLFLEGYQEYQLFLIERKNQREKKKCKKLLWHRKNGRKLSNFFDEEEYPETIEQKVPLKIKYRSSQEGIFMKFLNEVKVYEAQNSQKIRNNEQQEFSSDDHDENQDLQQIKLKQFNKLISQSARYQLGTHESRKLSLNKKNTEKLRNQNKINEQNFEEEIDFFKENAIRQKMKSSCSSRPRNSTITQIRRQNPKELNEEEKNNSQSLILKNKTKRNIKKEIRQNQLNQLERSPSKKRKNVEENVKWVQLNFPERSEKSDMPNTLQVEAMRRINKIKHAKQKSKNPKEIKMTIVGSQHELTNEKKIQSKLEEFLTNIESRSRRLKSSVKYVTEEKCPQNKFNISSLFLGAAIVKPGKSQGRGQVCSANKRVRKISLDSTPFEVKQCWHRE